MLIARAYNFKPNSLLIGIFYRERSCLFDSEASVIIRKSIIIHPMKRPLVILWQLNFSRQITNKDIIYKYFVSVILYSYEPQLEVNDITCFYSCFFCDFSQTCPCGIIKLFWFQMSTYRRKLPWVKLFLDFLLIKPHYHISRMLQPSTEPP